jgi:hypothetical protein
VAGDGSYAHGLSVVLFSSVDTPRESRTGNATMKAKAQEPFEWGGGSFSFKRQAKL